MRWGAVALAVLLVGCSKGRSTDTRSSAFPTSTERVRFVKAYVLSPTDFEDAEFHIVLHDNSRGFIAGSDDYDMRIAVRVQPELVEKWTIGCSEAALSPRFAWAKEILGAREGWDVKSKPQTVVCARGEQRVLHVKEGIIFRQLSAD